MKKAARRSASRPASARRRHAGDPGGWLVWVDQRPLRRRAASACRRALQQVEKTRAEWQRFEQEDRPAFARWSAAHFGAQLTELRDLDLALREKERLIDEVEIEYAWIGASSYRAAYLAVLRRRRGPEPHRAEPPEETGPTEPEPPPDFAKFSAPRKRAIFEQFVQDFLGLDPDALPRKEYQRMYREFAAEVGQGARPAAEPPPPPATPPRPDDARLKEIYRVLVRRLHPDTRADGDAAVGALWHEVQEAYLAGNLARLELLQALTDLRGRTVGGQTSLGQMRAVLTELEQTRRALQESLRAARKDPAWRFSRGARREVVEARLQRCFAKNIAARRKRLRACEALLARWARPLPERRAWSSEWQIEFGF